MGMRRGASKAVAGRRAVLLGTALGVLAVGALVRPWVAAQAQAAVVLATVADAPGLTWVTAHMTGDPRVSDARVGGAPATILRPAGEAPWPTIVLLNGATPLGRRNEHVLALANGLARAGYLVVVPDLPGLRSGEITRKTVRATVAAAAATSDDTSARGGKVALFGVSTGGSLALLAAEDPSLARRVAVVAAIGVFTDIRSVLQLATTGTYRDGDRVIPYKSKPFLGLASSRSVVAALPAGPSRTRLLALLRGVPSNAGDPLAVLESLPRSRLDKPARSVVALLANHDPRRFDALYAALPPTVRETCRVLSPVAAADRLQVPVLLAAAENDAYFPPVEARRLAVAAPDGTVAVTQAFTHGPPSAFPRGIVELAQLDSFLVRALQLTSG